MKGALLTRRALGKVGLFLKRNSPTILSCMSAAGTIATTAMAIKATPKAMMQIRHDSREKHDGDPYAYTKFEAFRSAWKYYIPTTIMAASTVACTFGANVLNKKQQAAMASAYILLENSYKEYKNKVKTLFGTDADSMVRKAVVKDKYIEDKNPHSGEGFLFYEYNYGEFFERSREEVLSAEYRFNLKFTSRGHASLNDFYGLLSLPKTDPGNNLIWTFNDECPWVDFEHELVELEDGMECYIINLPYPPNF
jgi:hypothetical protein